MFFMSYMDSKICGLYGQIRNRGKNGFLWVIWTFLAALAANIFVGNAGFYELYGLFLPILAVFESDVDVGSDSDFDWVVQRSDSCF